MPVTIWFSKMIIPVDIDSDGNTHFIVVEDQNPAIFDHPSNDGTKTDILGVLKHHNANPQAREVGGWHERNQLPGEDREYSRWERLVNAVKELPPDHPLVALHLK